MVRSKKYKPILLVIVLLLIVGGIFVLGRDKDRKKLPDGSRQLTHTPPHEPHAKQEFDKKTHPTNEAASIWVIVNKSRPLRPMDYAPDDLVDIGNGQSLRQEAAIALQKMTKAATTEGLDIQSLSGYRSYHTQQAVYAREVTTYGQDVADTQSAKPGHSEHQTGLSVDVGGGGCGIEDCFGDTAEGKWVAAHAYKYGFIIRYPPGKDNVTGYRYEPWHLRYIGKDLAAEMKKQNVTTLEEFFGL